MLNTNSKNIFKYCLLVLFIALNIPISATIINADPPSSVPQQKLIEPDPSDRPSAAQQMQIDRKYGMFCHFGINTYAGKEWTDGKVPPAVYAPPEDIAAKADQWVKTAHEAGMRYFLCITKHHDGFCLWDSKHTEYDVGHPTVKVHTDVVKAVADACKKYNIAFSVYYSAWDRHEQSYKDPVKYKEYMKAQLTELLTQYGPVSEVWFDGNWERPAKDWFIPEIYDFIKRHQPNCQVTVNWNIGLPGKPDAHMVKPEQQQAGYPIRYFPTDFRISDPYLPRVDDPKQFTHGEKSYYMPFEATVTVSKKNHWFGFDGDHGAKSVDELIKIFNITTSNNNLLVLNIPPGKDGNLIPSQVQAVLELGKRLNLGPGKPFPDMKANPNAIK